jgi:crossover junction endodeoxyribonuclease RuvC
VSVILGCDPGSIKTGWALINAHPIGYIESGVIALGHGDFWQRIGLLKEELSRILNKVRPDILVLERAFVGLNKQSALLLSQIRGAIMISCFEHSLTFAEYAPREVKMQITGYGNADKEQVEKMVRNSLSLNHNISLKSDESDALAIALCHAYQMGLRQKIQSASSSRPAYKGLRR